MVSVYEQAIQDKKENRYVTLKAEESGERAGIDFAHTSAKVFSRFDFKVRRPDFEDSRDSA